MCLRRIGLEEKVEVILVSVSRVLKRSKKNKVLFLGKVLVVVCGRL